MSETVRHILSLSGGKDSTALAVYMRDRVPNMEYVFCDTGKELTETYEYLAKLENLLGKRIMRLQNERGFDHWLRIYNGYLPSSDMRWCTKMLKIKPFEKYVGRDRVMMYIGIRADEDREGYMSPSKPTIHPVYPFKEDGIALSDVYRILEDSGLGLPAYYEWRTRSGCYFCFFQRKMEWIGLLERHPGLFAQAMNYEKTDLQTGKRYTWNDNESLAELSSPERAQQIKERHQHVMETVRQSRANLPLAEVLAQVYDDEDDDMPCFHCHW